MLDIYKCALIYYGVGKDYFLIVLSINVSIKLLLLSFGDCKTGGETYHSEIIYCQSHGNDGHQYNGKRIFLIVFTKPQTDAEELKYVKWI